VPPVPPDSIHVLGFYYEQRSIRLDNDSCTVKDAPKNVQKTPAEWRITVQHAFQQATVENVSITIYDSPMKVLIIDDGATNVRVRDVRSQTPGWKGTKENVLRGAGDEMKNLTI
jgi:hypothetical protein